MDNKKIGRQLNMDELEKVAGGGIGKKQQLASIGGEGDGSVDPRFDTHDLGERLLGEIEIDFENPDLYLYKDITVVQNID